MVDASLRDIITTLEPDVHQFWPMRVTLELGEHEWPEPYFGMRIGQFRNAFVPVEGTCKKADPSLIGYLSKGLTPSSDYKKLHFSKTQIDGAHLWREKLLYQPNIFLSDTLRDAIKEAGLNIMKHYRGTEI